MKEGREFESEQEYDRYVQDLSKGLEMLNLLLEANLYFEKTARGRDLFFRTITNKMREIRENLK